MNKLALVAWLSDVVPEHTEYLAWGWASTLDSGKCAVAESALATGGLDAVLDLFLVGEVHGGLGETDAHTLVASIAA